MTARPTRWETDPLFSAAEVVQDSADRMESFYRLLMHESDLVHEDHKIHRIPSSLEFHKRNLITALETTKWQLEDFERAVHAISDETGSREHALHGHNQFISAIRAQVLDVQKYLDQQISDRDSIRSIKSIILTEPDADGLALFLSGDNPEKKAMSGLFDSTVADDEIVELESGVRLEVNDARNLNHASGSSKFNGMWKFDSEYSENGNDKAREDDVIYWGKFGYFLGLANRFWHPKKYWHSRTFTKKRKDGEIMDDLSDMSSSPGQFMQSLLCLRSRLGFCAISNFSGLRSATNYGKLLEPLSRRLERLQVFSQHTYNRRLTPLALVTVTLVGVVMGFRWLIS